MAKYTRRFRRRRNFRRRPFRGGRAGYGKTKMSRINIVKVATPGAIVPDQLMTIMHYTDDIKHFILGTAQALNASYGVVVYRANSVWDPSTYAGNSSPNGYTQLAALYRRYRVVGMKIRCTFVNTSTEPVTVFIAPTMLDVTNVTGPPGYIYNAVQQITDYPYAKWQVVSAQGGMDRCTLKSYISTKKFVGEHGVMYDDSYSAFNNANPTQTVYWNVGAYTTDGDPPTTGNVGFEAKITYYVQWYNRQPIFTNNPLGDVDDKPDDDEPPALLMKEMVLTRKEPKVLSPSGPLTP